jgi:hypothetical protein
LDKGISDAAELVERLVDAKLVEELREDEPGQAGYGFQDLLRLLAREEAEADQATPCTRPFDAPGGPSPGSLSTRSAIIPAGPTTGGLAAHQDLALLAAQDDGDRNVEASFLCSLGELAWKQHPWPERQ